jgi:hypothetical protein
MSQDPRVLREYPAKAYTIDSCTILLQLAASGKASEEEADAAHLNTNDSVTHVTILPSSSAPPHEAVNRSLEEESLLLPHSGNTHKMLSQSEVGVVDRI